MMKYLYLWIDGYIPLHEFSQKDEYLFSDFGVNLSSEFDISHTWEKEILTLKCDCVETFQKGFYSENIEDIMVLVGDNGAGKSSFLLALYQIIAGGLIEPQSVKKFALIYLTDSGQIRVRTTLSKEKVEFPSNWKLDSENETFLQPHKSPYVIRYTESFDDQEFKIDSLALTGDWADTCDISTDALLIKDKENLNNRNLSVNYGYKADALSSYYAMEQSRKIKFLLKANNDYANAFWNLFNLPKVIEMSVLRVNVLNAIDEIINFHIENYSIGKIVEKDLLCFGKTSKDKWIEFQNSKKYCEKFFTKEKTDELTKDIRKNYVDFYVSLVLTEQFRFAVLMSYYRTYSSNFYPPFFVDISLQELVNENGNSNLKDSKIWGKGKLSEYKNNIDEIIKIFDGEIEEKKGFAQYPKNGNVGYLNNNKIYFDLQLHLDQLKKIYERYDSILKLTPFLDFKFIRPLSSGEAALLKLFYRLYDALAKPTNNNSNHEVHLLLDEVDLYLHPEWQRQWLYFFVKGIKIIEDCLRSEHKIHAPLKFQIIMTTHSPFMITDFLSENIVMMQREKGVDGVRTGKTCSVKNNSNILAGNIFDILETGFFLDGTMGTLISQKLNSLLQKIQNKKISDSDLFVINKIGDPIIKAILLQKIQCRASYDKN